MSLNLERFKFKFNLSLLQIEATPAFLGVKSAPAGSAPIQVVEWIPLENVVTPWQAPLSPLAEQTFVQYNFVDPLRRAQKRMS